MRHSALLRPRTIRGMLQTLVKAIVLTRPYSARNSFLSVPIAHRMPAASRDLSVRSRFTTKGGKIMPLPTAVDLLARVTEIISSTANCPVIWAQHSDPLTLSEILAIKERLVEYSAGVVDTYLGDKNRPSRGGQVCGRSSEQGSTPWAA